MKLGVTLFAHSGSVVADLALWLADTFAAIARDATVTALARNVAPPFPTDVARNAVVAEARAAGLDWLLMLDHDTVPAPGWWREAWDVAQRNQPVAPCVIGAPYCMGPPEEICAVCDWSSPGNAKADPEFNLQNIPRTDAARRTGTQLVAALPTGCCLFDMRAFDTIIRADPFKYEFTDGRRIRLASTEDAVLSRDMALAGVDQLCTWDHWATHVKTYRVGKPQPLLPSHVSTDVRAACCGALP